MSSPRRIWRRRSGTRSLACLILSLKARYHDAATDEQKLLANEAANQLRSSYGNYRAGRRGCYYPREDPGQIDAISDQINNFGSFTLDQEALVYDNQYASSSRSSWTPS